MNLTKIISIVLFVVAIGLAYFLYDSINETIEFQNSITTTEKQLTDKLAVIREAEKVYLEQKGRYTANFDSLINFIETGVVPVTVRTETIIPLSYGVDSVQVKIDTIAMVPAKEKIFKKNYAVHASSDGTFLGFNVKVGDYVVKGSKSYKMKPNNANKALEYTFLDKGTISSIADLKVGDQVTKGQNLINLWDYHLNPNVDIKTLGIVPGSGKPFDIYVGKIDKSGVKVSVIEVKDPAPINPERKATNEAKNRQPLGFGSRVDVGTTGNWE
jgi:biotin carboxyl carrier protein